MKKLILILLCAVMTVSCVACSVGGGGDVGEDGKRKTYITITRGKGGFGSAWLEDVSNEFLKTHKNVGVKISSDSLSNGLGAQIKTGEYVADIVMGNIVPAELYSLGKLRDLDDVYESVPVGESKKIIDKISKTESDQFIMADGKHGALSSLTSIVGITYNKTVLDKAFPDGYVLPRTTTELNAMCDRLLTKSVIPFIGFADDDYTSFLANIFWAQYDGLDGFSRYSDGSYINEAGELITADKSPNDATALNPIGKQRAIETIRPYSVSVQNGGYLHTYATSMGFQEAQAAYLGYPYAKEKRPTAFLVNGTWFENEMNETLEEELNNDIRMMKSPVISSIIEKCDTVKTDKVLCDVVDYVDKVTATKPANVSDADITRIKKARYTYTSLTSSMTILVPKNAKNYDLVKEYLVFLCSDKAADICAKRMKGLTTPYGYNALDNKNIEKSEFTSSLLNIQKDCGEELQGVAFGWNKPLAFLGGLTCFDDLNMIKYFFDGSHSAADFNKKEYARFNKDWKYMLKNSNITAS